MRFWALCEQGRESGELKPLHDDPFHCASAAIGSTVFYVAALSRLVPQQGFQPLDPQQAAAHKEEALLANRLLLGIDRTRVVSGQRVSVRVDLGGRRVIKKKKTRKKKR